MEKILYPLFPLPPQHKSVADTALPTSASSLLGRSLIPANMIHQSQIGTMMNKRSRLDEAGACATTNPTGTTASSTSSEHVQGIKTLSASATSTLHTGSTSASSSSSSLTSMSQQPAAGVETGNDEDLMAVPTTTTTTTDASLYSLSEGPHEVAPPQRSPRGPKLPQKVGRWSLDEKILFLYGLKMYGKGRWKRMSKFLPDRSLVQIKSHGQKVLKRLSQGEDIFRRLEENVGKLQTLLKELNLTFEPEVISSPNPALLQLSPSNNSNSKRKRENSNNDGGTGGREHILAASALCQLATPGTSGSGSDDAANAVNSLQQQTLQGGATSNQVDANALLLQAHLLGFTGAPTTTTTTTSTPATATSLQHQQQQQTAAAVLQQQQQQGLVLVPTPPALVQRQVLEQQQQQRASSTDNGSAGTTKQHSSWDGDSGLPPQQQQFRE